MQLVKIDTIEVRAQVRTVFDEKNIEELAASIKEHGIINPLRVRAKSGSGNGYILVAGERRLRAAMLSGLKQVPVIIKNENSDKQRIVQLIENLQREDLNDMDLANSFRSILDEGDVDIHKLAKQIGKSEAYIQQRLRLHKVAPEVQEALQKGEIDFGGARALSSLSKADQVEALDEAVAEEAAALKKRGEKPPQIALLPAAAEALEAENDNAEEAAEEAAAAATEKTTSKKSSKKATKASAKTVKRVTARRKRSDEGKQRSIASTEERFDEKLKEWVPGFIDEDTKGAGLDEQMTGRQARNLLNRFAKYLLEQRVLLIR